VERPDTIEHQLDATFGEHLSLIGFDLHARPWHPGDDLSIALYWQAAAATQSDAKVFLHLYDASGNLGAQSDGWAFHGTRPPYAWVPGEMVKDPRAHSHPDDLPQGTYGLEVGLYNPDGSGRLPAYQDGVHQVEDRVALTIIEVIE
jgi:hypothetical protein